MHLPSSIVTSTSSMAYKQSHEDEFDMFCTKRLASWGPKLCEVLRCNVDVTVADTVLHSDTYYSVVCILVTSSGE